MLGLGPTELLILAAVLVVIVVLMRVLSRAGGGARSGGAPEPTGPGTPIPAELQSRIRTLAAQGQRIQAIKMLREATGLSLLDAKNAVDAIAAGNALPTARPDLAYRARSLAAAGRADEAVRLVATETGMSAPEATVFIRALLP